MATARGRTQLDSTHARRRALQSPTRARSQGPGAQHAGPPHAAGLGGRAWSAAGQACGRVQFPDSVVADRLPPRLIYSDDYTTHCCTHHNTWDHANAYHLQATPTTQHNTRPHHSRVPSQSRPSQLVTHQSMSEQHAATPNASMQHGSDARP